jgi:Fic family protein
VGQQDRTERTRLEAENVLRQFDHVRETVQELLEEAGSTSGRSPLTIELLARLNSLALQGLEPRAGQLRTGRMFITNSEHRPPDPVSIPRLLHEMCLYVGEQWEQRSALHLSAYVMWRLNWIHPYWDGNGRTSRAASYLVLCVRLGYILPGTRTIPESIARNKRSYHEALEDADRAWRGGRLDVSTMERLLARYLERQLESAGDT